MIRERLSSARQKGVNKCWSWSAETPGPRSCTSMAWEDTTEDVSLAGSTELYRGVEYSFWLPSQDSAVAVQFRADTRGDLDVAHLVDSSIAWDGETLTHWFSGIEDGGVQNLSQDTSLTANVHVDVFGYEFTARVWEETFAWKGEAVFDTALIPQGWATSTVLAEAQELVSLNEVFEVMEGVELMFAGEVVPTSRVVLSGTHMDINGKQITELDWAEEIALPAVNNGTMPMQASWSGVAEATFGVELRPMVGVCVDDFGCVEVPFSYTWQMASETVDVVTQTTPYLHDMPAVGMADATVNVGNVTIGESATVAVSMENLGLVALEGYAVVEGEGFVLDTNELFAEAGDLASVVLTFTPEVEGQVVQERDELDLEPAGGEGEHARLVGEGDFVLEGVEQERSGHGLELLPASRSATNVR